MDNIWTDRSGGQFRDREVWWTLLELRGLEENIQGVEFLFIFYSLLTYKIVQFIFTSNFYKVFTTVGSKQCIFNSIWKSRRYSFTSLALITIFPLFFLSTLI